MRHFKAVGKGKVKKEILKKAFMKLLPIKCSYLFVSMAYGIMMEDAGVTW
ncbi:hypothetical protein K040078D81_45350 [Blautia hominis]|uniref:Uncharacterized protein n=1 Tax=Blautia hominis TaxID=2025493 RepID=A0ABQ0BG36_9FIRM